MSLSELFLGRYFVFEKNSGRKIRNFHRYESAVDLCQKLNTAAYFAKINERFDIHDKRSLSGKEQS